MYAEARWGLCLNPLGAPLSSYDFLVNFHRVLEPFSAMLKSSADALGNFQQQQKVKIHWAHVLLCLQLFSLAA
jgi:hypothetical protein